MPVLAPDFAHFANFALRLGAIPHRLVAPLPLVPHPQQGWMAGVYEVGAPRSIPGSDGLPKRQMRSKGGVTYFTSTADSATPSYISLGRQLAKVIGVATDEGGLMR